MVNDYVSDELKVVFSNFLTNNFIDKMDDTQQSRVSDAAATRKRRSSILKSQRPSRTPFSELEFNVATPTDTAKSRRVSFSRRTGVAEFVTNEATTTWKNFYEEHNKSLESSSNDSSANANASRQPVGHLGRRIFDQQFEEVEAVDFIRSLNPTNSNGSLNNVNFTEQLASLECPSDLKLSAPQSNFELSAFTDRHSKLFGNDFTTACVSEISGRIDINFSAMQPVGGQIDDLDEIQKDLERASNVMGCHGPFSDGKDISEYIEVDLNMTHVALRNEEDMSITDTVHSPVQDVSKSGSVDKKVSLNHDWVTDKENIAINPYAAPHESLNFAVNDEPDEVLVFDGKRLTIQTDKPGKDKNYRQTLLPNASAETPQRKTIVLNVNDDLPNFVDDVLNFKSENSGIGGIPDFKNSTTTIDSDKDFSMTLPVNRVDIVPKKTILDTTGNLSMTQVLPTNILNEKASEPVKKSQDNSEKRRTIVFEESSGNISVTQSLPIKILNDNGKIPERRRTVVYEDDTGNISITQAVPSNILDGGCPKGNEKRKTIVFDDDQGNISVTQAISSNMILEKKDQDKRKTIVFDDDAGNVSITQALPANIVVVDKELQEKRRTIIYEDDTGNISVTQAIPSNVILAQTDTVPDRRRTVIYEDDTGNISVTQALPTNVIEKLASGDEIKIDELKIQTQNSPPQSVPTSIIIKDSDVNKRRTIVYDDDTGNISITQAIPTKLISGFNEGKSDVTSHAVEDLELDKSCTRKPREHKRATIVYDNDDDVSMTEAIPANIILSNKVIERSKTVIFDPENANVSTTKAIPTNIFLLSNLDSGLDQSIHNVLAQKTVEDVHVNVIDYDLCEEKTPVPTVEPVESKRKTFEFHTNDCDDENDVSISEATPKVQNISQETETRKSVVFDNDTVNMSMTKPIPADLLAFQNDILNKSSDKQIDLKEPELVANPSLNVVVFQAANTQSTPKLRSNRTEQGDLKSERTLDSNGNSEARVNDDITSTADVPSADISLIHPRVEEKSEILNLKISSTNLDKNVEGNLQPDAERVVDIIVLQNEPPKDTVAIRVIQTKAAIDTMDTDVVPSEPALETIDIQTIDKPSDSVLESLLDMSTTSMDGGGNDDKDVMTSVTSKPSSAKDSDATSNESMFYIMKDSDSGGQTDKEVDTQNKSLKSLEFPAIENNSPLPLEYKEEPAEVTDLQKKLEQLKTTLKEDSSTSANRFYEKVVSKDLEGIVERDENIQLREQSQTFKKANDTQELLDMISDFTEKKEDGEVSPVKVKALEYKDVNESKRISVAPNRQSIVLNREDLLNSISMAQAALQKSKLALDDTDNMVEDTKDTSMEQISSKKSVRTSNEVVKTLNFDDESLCETSTKSDTKASPLKKTAFGETAYMNESKGKVIPTYLKDVSDGIKELMLDLVKPTSDNMPFETGGIDKSVRKIPSTQSTQIQANLVTSSQVDIECELSSNPESGYDMDKMSSLTGGVLHKSRSRSFRSPVKFSTNSSERSSEFEVPSSRQRYMYSRSPVERSTHPKVLVFDHLNPLNNILLGSMDYSDAHRYNPKKSDETLCGSEQSRSALIHFESSPKDDYEVEKVSTQYRVESKLPRQRAPRGIISYKHDDDQESIISSVSKTVSIDQSIDVRIMEVTDKEVNTLIAMKGGKELLEASSSLTLVDDAFGQPYEKAEKPTSCQQDNQPPGHSKPKVSKSPVKMIYAIEEQEMMTDNVSKTESTLQSDEPSDRAKKNKAKKRIYSPATDKSKPIHSAVDVTPKPNLKMQKISNSPNIYNPIDLAATKETHKPVHETTKMAAEKDLSETVEPVVGKKAHPSKEQDKKSPRKSKDKKPGPNITIQQLITDYNMDEKITSHILDKQILHCLNAKSECSATPASQSDMIASNSLDVVSSFTSSKNLNNMRDVLSASTTQSQQSTLQSNGSKMDWHPEVISAISSSLCDSDSGVNVVAKIDMLPFMGSHECEWESSSADTWSFRLLHGRLRLTARLAHRHDNATRTRVRGDTPVLDVVVETVQHDKKNPVATLCVRFACETMRYMVSRAFRGHCFASDIPPLLRRCAAVARVALRWGRAMHDAKLHLAYTLDNDGYLTLKVANIPLRSVWEVSMRIELVVDDAREAPWPRAGGVRVTRVVSDVNVNEADIKRALAHTPRDWGHAPRTIWRMFRYLKHKTRDDDILLGA